MFVVAKSLKGKEFFYVASSAHAVPKTSAKKICDDLNSVNYDLNEKYVWHVHEVDQYDNAFYYAEHQKFAYRNHKLVKIAS